MDFEKQKQKLKKKGVFHCHVSTWNNRPALSVRRQGLWSGTVSRGGARCAALKGDGSSVEHIRCVSYLPACYAPCQDGICNILGTGARRNRTSLFLYARLRCPRLTHLSVTAATWRTTSASTNRRKKLKSRENKKEIESTQTHRSCTQSIHQHDVTTEAGPQQ